ncbi:MAG: signal recognition particle-docking protein FtsY [Candidatus Limnocylindrales bacterium]|nr:signal recognition particle-docking protein FtsY [Candidatus Limnocylindrales bacterium]
MTEPASIEPESIEPESVEPGWEPDPADFDDPASNAEVLEAGSALEVDPEPAGEPFAPEPASVVPPAGPDAAEPPTLAPTAGLDAGLERTRGGFMARLRGFLGGVEAGGPSWDDVEETLIAGDVGAALAIDLVERARARRDPGGPEAAIRAELAALLVPRDAAWTPRPATGDGPAVVLVVGVNGTGKTTTIGKLASRYAAEGRSVILAAADTFRAAAIEQLRIWADRSGVPVVAHAPGADPGAVVYDALDAAVARHADLVIADTAGRLHTRSNLMDELAKIRRIVDKRLAGAKPEILFVLDATTGQNGLAQAKAFHEAVGLTGIVLTKLDSSAKGGIVFAIEDALKVPVRFVGVGEGVADLIPFDPEAFVAALFA